MLKKKKKKKVKTGKNPGKIRHILIEPDQVMMHNEHTQGEMRVRSSNAGNTQG